MGYALRQEDYVTPEAYLEMEMASQERHEYVDGEVFAMVGTSSIHNELAFNITSLLKNHLRGKPCHIYMESIKLRVETANCYFYPDVMVTCSEADRQNQYIKNDPIVVVEILSPSTALYDRDRKFAAYRQLESLQEYVLVDAEQLSIECYRRADGGEWILRPYLAGETVTLHSLGLTFPLESAYQDIELLTTPTIAG